MSFTTAQLEDLIRALNTSTYKEPNPSANRIRLGPREFNAKLIREHFLKKALIAKGHPTQDLIIFITLFIKYGNNVQKALAKINIKISNIVRRKCVQYGVPTDLNHTKHGLKQDQLSPSRIAHAFPTGTAKVILVNKTRGILEYSIFFGQELPLVMQHTIFNGLIPAEPFTDELKGIALVLNVEKSVILSRLKVSTVKETLGEMIESSIEHVDAAINNGINDKQKLNILEQAGILVKDDGELKLAEATEALVNKLEGIKSLYALKYADAVRKARRINNTEEVDSDSDSDYMLFNDILF